jgi:hypothetical protein
MPQIRMKNLGYVIALFLLLSCSAALALVVKEPGEFNLDQNTTVRVTIRKITAVGPFFEYQLRRKSSAGVELSTDPMFTAMPANEIMMFYWDDSRKVLWFGSRKHLGSLSETDLEKDKRVTGHSTVWDTTGAWLHWDAAHMPPETFLKRFSNKPEKPSNLSQHEVPKAYQKLSS